MSLGEKIHFFFKKPEECPELPGWAGTLHLLRRDISMCFGVDPNTGVSLNYSSIWPGTMAILAGIDLLGKFYAGDDSSGGGDRKKGVGSRFKGFIHEFIDNNQSNAETIYQLRNALLHSFGLYSETLQGKKYRFVLTRGIEEFIKTDIDNRYFIDVMVLWKKFEDGVNKYLADLQQSQDLQNNFDLMFDKYGSVRIG